MIATASLLAAGAPDAAACEPAHGAAGAQRVEGAHYVLAWRTMRRMQVKA